MRRWILLVGIALLVIIATYLGGWLPERRVRLQSEQQAAELQTRLAGAEADLRANRVLGDLLMLEDAVARRNFGQAQSLSSALFDRVGDEASKPHAPSLTSAFTDLQTARDGVTAALARTDPAVSETLKTLEVKLRAGLGYPVP